MKKIWLTILVVNFFFLFTACGPEENTEVPDFTTYTEIEVIQTIVDPIYRFVDIELTKDNMMYIVIYEEVHKGKFIAVEEGDTLFSIEAEIDMFTWFEAYEEDELHAYYK
jgi:hypothetical protein